jgi:hypothetical protein
MKTQDLIDFEKEMDDQMYTSGQNSFPLFVFIQPYFASNLLLSRDMT